MVEFLFLDLDDTILDFHKAEAIALSKTLTDFGISPTEESLRTLYQFRDELQGYSKIITYASKIERWHLKTICQKLFPVLSLPIKARLTGNNPSIFLFNIYKLMYYIHLNTIYGVTNM